MKNYLLGLATIPAMVIAWVIIVLMWQILCPTVRETLKSFRCSLRPGYRWYDRLWLTPIIFWDCLKDQTHAWIIDEYS